MESHSIIRDTLLFGSLYIAVLVGIAVPLAMIQEQRPLSFIFELFTDPIWLFIVVITLYSVVRGIRKAKRKQREKAT